MKSILSNLSLSLILRQFFCGVVFFLPYLLNATTGNTLLIKMGAIPSSVILPMTILSLIVGTIIYHLEKNTYCYIVQSVLLNVFYFYRDRKVENKSICETEKYGSLKNIWHGVKNIIKRIFLFLWDSIRSLRVVSIIFLIISLIFIWIAGLNGITGSFTVVLIALVILIAKPVSFYQKVWSIDESLLIVSDSILKPHLIMKHLDAWSDNIHCVQCCCFAWIFGAIFAKVQSIHDTYHSCECYICPDAWQDYQTTICEVLNSADCQIALLILFLELVFEFHRFYHLYNITENK